MFKYLKPIIWSKTGIFFPSRQKELLLNEVWFSGLNQRKNNVYGPNSHTFRMSIPYDGLWDIVKDLDVSLLASLYQHGYTDLNTIVAKEPMRLDGRSDTTEFLSVTYDTKSLSKDLWPTHCTTATPLWLLPKHCFLILRHFCYPKKSRIYLSQ